MKFSLLESENAAPQEAVVPKQPLLNLLNDERGSIRAALPGTLLLFLATMGMGYILIRGNMPKFVEPPAIPEATPGVLLPEVTRFKGAISYLEKNLKEGQASKFDLSNRKWTVRLIPPVIEKIEVLDKDGITPTDFPTTTEASRKIDGWEAGKTYRFRPDILITEEIDHTGIQHEWLMAHESDPANQMVRVYTFNPANVSIYGTPRARLLDKEGKEVTLLVLKRDSTKLVDTILGKDYATPVRVITPTPVGTLIAGPAFDWTPTLTK